MDQEHIEKEVTAYEKRKVAEAAIRKAHKLNEDISSEHKANKRLAIVGFVVLLAILSSYYLYGKIFSEPLESRFQFNVKVVDLAIGINSAKSEPGGKKIRVTSERLGQVEATVSSEIYESLNVGDELIIVPARKGENGFFRVTERTNQRAP